MGCCCSASFCAVPLVLSFCLVVRGKLPGRWRPCMEHFGVIVPCSLTWSYLHAWSTLMSLSSFAWRWAARPLTSMHGVLCLAMLSCIVKCSVFLAMIFGHYGMLLFCRFWCFSFWFFWWTVGPLTSMHGALWCHRALQLIMALSSWAWRWCWCLGGRHCRQQYRSFVGPHFFGWLGITFELLLEEGPFVLFESRFADRSRNRTAFLGLRANRDLLFEYL